MSGAVIVLALSLPGLAANVWAWVFLRRFVKPIVAGIKTGALSRRYAYNHARAQMLHTLRIEAGR